MYKLLTWTVNLKRNTYGYPHVGMPILIKKRLNNVSGTCNTDAPQGFTSHEGNG
jgi:hypothetical protein